METLKQQIDNLISDVSSRTLVPVTELIDRLLDLRNTIENKKELVPNG